MRLPVAVFPHARPAAPLQDGPVVVELLGAADADAVGLLVVRAVLVVVAVLHLAAVQLGPVVGVAVAVVVLAGAARAGGNLKKGDENIDEFNGYNRFVSRESLRRSAERVRCFDQTFY